MMTIKDYEKLWNKESRGTADQEAFWDARAESFAAAQNRSKEKTPQWVVDYLVANNLIDEDSSVLDIGGGSGRYAIPIAKQAKHVTLTDISQNMLDFAAENAAAASLENLDYVKLDVTEADIAEIGWDGKFDLVFATMCPAVRSEAALDKMIEASKGNGFIGQYIETTNNVTEAIMDALDFMHGGDPHNDRDAIYAIFNILWLKGYQPEISYIKEERVEELSEAAAVERYAKHFFETAEAKNIDLTNLVKSLAEDGKITVTTKKTLALIHWNVTEKRF